MRTKLMLSIVATSAVLALGGCASNQQAGAVTGAVAGGLLGHTVGGGAGKVLATGVGAAVGAVVGSEVGRNMDQQQTNPQRVIVEDRPVYIEQPVRCYYVREYDPYYRREVDRRICRR